MYFAIEGAKDPQALQDIHCDLIYPSEIEIKTLFTEEIACLRCGM